MKHKVGDKVEVLSLDSIKKHPKYRKDINYLCVPGTMVSRMIENFAGSSMTISEVDGNRYRLEEDLDNYIWSDEMFWDEQNNLMR